MSSQKLFDVSGLEVAITGATGVLCGPMAADLGEQGAKVALLGRNMEVAKERAASINEKGGTAIAVYCDVLLEESVQEACQKVQKEFGSIRALVNGAGGNNPDATTNPGEKSFFDLDLAAIEDTLRLNCMGTIIPTQIFGRQMLSGSCIVNISSMAAQRPLTKVVAYSTAKAAVDAFTKWAAVDFADSGIRVNAIAPGFFLTKQNKKLLTNEDGSLTARGEQIICNTPQGRFGEPSYLLGALRFLLSPASQFVTGQILPVCGGFGVKSV